MKKNGEGFLSYPLVLEGLVWLLYVAMYKYSYHLDHGNFPPSTNLYFPYNIVCLYALCSSLYLIFYYRYLVPRFLFKKRYGWLLGLTFSYIVIVGTINNRLLAWGFTAISATPEQTYFAYLQRGYLDWNLITTDAIAFLAVGFSIFSYRNEVLRRKTETAHLELQLHLLKAQLQPHFLFNALNGIYAMSLKNSKNTSKFILLLSQLMHYILHDAAKEQVSLSDEIRFMNIYFEFEHLRFPQADIRVEVTKLDDTRILPPLLFLPLMENSFKHGKQTAIDEATVDATLTQEGDWLQFRISNELLPKSGLPNIQKSGIGLTNLQKRLARYYPERHQLQLHQTENKYIAELRIKL